MDPQLLKRIYHLAMNPPLLKKISIAKKKNFEVFVWVKKRKGPSIAKNNSSRFLSGLRKEKGLTGFEPMTS